MDPSILDKFYREKSPEIRSCLEALRDIILRSNPEISQTVKYGMPCFTYRTKAILYLWTDKKNDEPYILFVEGNQLDHPLLESGDRKRMKILRIDPFGLRVTRSRMQEAG